MEISPFLARPHQPPPLMSIKKGGIWDEGIVEGGEGERGVVRVEAASSALLLRVNFHTGIINQTTEGIFAQMCK